MGYHYTCLVTNLIVFPCLKFQLSRKSVFNDKLSCKYLNKIYKIITFAIIYYAESIGIIDDTYMPTS